LERYSLNIGVNKAYTGIAYYISYIRLSNKNNGVTKALFRLMDPKDINKLKEKKIRSTPLNASHQKNGSYAVLCLVLT